MKLEDMEELNESLDNIHESLLDIKNNYESKIRIYKHNAEVRKEREEICIRRLTKVVKYLENLGLDIGEINNIMKLEEENF